MRWTGQLDEGAIIWIQGMRGGVGNETYLFEIDLGV